MERVVEPVDGSLSFRRIGLLDYISVCRLADPSGIEERYGVVFACSLIVCRPFVRISMRRRKRR